MELRNLKTFQAVAESLNLTKAAERLGYSQPGITLQIKSLEKELGRPLFTRVGRQTYLTPAGELLKHHVDRMMDVMRELDEDLKKLDHPYAPLIISSPEFYCTHYLPSIIGSYVKSYPEVRLKMLSCNSVETTKLVISNQADVGIIGGDCEYAEVEVVPIGDEDFVLVASAGLVTGHDLPGVLNTFPFLMDREVQKVGGNLFAELDFTPTSLIECSSEEAIKQAARNHAGVCVLGEDIIQDEIASGELVVLHRFSNKLVTSLIYLKDRAEEASIHAFVSLVREVWSKARK